ncbi:uncharacterized protein LOC124157137 [Ischnura elegans]|uniref:uncharacterized protein LOC124157137 n=1 Tax=Ischnura elegans TaxID=197161 RepID=UPI001ED8BD30|nr:uncharacterized protein LOC124157137 [Ischnura elegans]
MDREELLPEPLSPLPPSNSSSSTPTAIPSSGWPFFDSRRQSSSAPSTPEARRRRRVAHYEESGGLPTPPQSGSKSRSRRHRTAAAAAPPAREAWEDEVSREEADDEGDASSDASSSCARVQRRKEGRRRLSRSSHPDGGSHPSKQCLQYRRSVATQTPSSNFFYTCRSCRRARRNATAASDRTASPRHSSHSRIGVEPPRMEVARRGSLGSALPPSTWQQVGRELLLIADDLSRSTSSLVSNKFCT